MSKITIERRTESRIKNNPKKETKTLLTKYERSKIIKEIHSRKEVKDKLSENRKDSKFIHKNGIQKRVPKHLFEEYISNGWIHGFICR